MSTTDTKAVSIIGAGVAGCAAACHLAQLGYRVKLYEKESSAHHKVCGEFFSPEALKYLNELGINFEQLGAARINKFSLYSKNFHTGFSFPENAYGVSRHKLDQLLLNKAKALGVEYFPNTLIKSFSDLGTKAIMLATGKHDLNSESKRDSENKSLIGLKMYFRLDQDQALKLKDHINLFSYPGGYAGMSFIENDQVNVSFLIDKKIYKELGSYNASIEYIESKNPKFKKILENARPLLDKALSISNLPYGYIFTDRKKLSASSENEIFRLGDQFAVIPSFAGSGMSIALYTAKQAALAYDQQPGLAAKSFHQNCYRELKPIISFGYIIHSMMQKPILSELAVMLAGFFPAIAKAIMNQTRIPFR